MYPPANLYDAHLHLQDPRLLSQLDEIMEETARVGIRRLVVNGTGPDDWQAVADLAKAYPTRIIPCFGLHPWKVPQHDDSWKRKLEHLLDTIPGACLGECGLDRWMKNPDIPAQDEAFRYQLDLAAERNLPITLHILKAWGWLGEILENSSLPSRGFLLHSFGGSLEVARQLIKMGAYFSFSGYFLHPRKAEIRDVFSQLPHDRILVETDAPDMLPPADFISHSLGNGANHPANLPTITRALAHLMNLPYSKACGQISENFKRFFS